MVAQPLVEPQIEAGRRLVEHLDARGMKPDAAFWLFSSASNDWRLMVAVKEVDELGPRGAYEKFLKLETQFSINDISLVSPKSDLVRLMRRALRTGNGISAVRLTGSAIDGTFIEDALIYRL